MKKMFLGLVSVMFLLATSVNISAETKDDKLEIVDKTMTFKVEELTSDFTSFRNYTVPSESYDIIDNLSGEVVATATKVNTTRIQGTYYIDAYTSVTAVMELSAKVELALIFEFTGTVRASTTFFGRKAFNGIREASVNNSQTCVGNICIWDMSMEGIGS